MRPPQNFSFIIRSSGARLYGLSFSLSYAIACEGIQHIAVIGHSDCRMVDLESDQEDFIKGLLERCGWSRKKAEKQFFDMYPHFEKRDALTSVPSEVRLIRSQYPGVTVAAVFYSIEDDYLYLVEEPC